MWTHILFRILWTGARFQARRTFPLTDAKAQEISGIGRHAVLSIASWPEVLYVEPWEDNFPWLADVHGTQKREFVYGFVALYGGFIQDIGADVFRLKCQS